MIAQGVLEAFSTEELEDAAHQRHVDRATRQARQASPCPFCEAERKRHPGADVVWGVYTADGLARHLKVVHGRPAR